MTRAPIIRLTLDPSELVVDNFAGGGGASTGIGAALGRDPDYAINHDGWIAEDRMKPDQPTPEKRARASLRRHTEAHEVSVFEGRRYMCGGCLAEIAAEIRAAVEAERRAIEVMAEREAHETEGAMLRLETEGATASAFVADKLSAQVAVLRRFAGRIRARGKS